MKVIEASFLSLHLVKLFSRLRAPTRSAQDHSATKHSRGVHD